MANMANPRGPGPGRSQHGPGTAGSTVPLPGRPRQPATRRAEIDLSEARKAFFLMAGFIAVIWIIQIANWAGRYSFDAQYGIIPRDVLRLPDLFVAPFLHASWSHIEANSGPLFVFGFLAAYRGVLKFLGVTVVVAVTSGIAVWFFQGSSSLTVGASGLIFGYFGYLIARGLIDRNLIDVLISVIMGLSYYYLVTEVVPGAPRGVSWLAHLGGLVGGIACGWVFRTRRGRAGKPAREPGPAPGSGPGGAGPATGSGEKPGGFQPGPDNPRASLHEELRKLGL